MLGASDKPPVPKKNGEGKGRKSIGDGNERTRTHGIVKRVLEFLTRNSHYTDYL